MRLRLRLDGSGGRVGLLPLRGLHLHSRVAVHGTCRCRVGDRRDRLRLLGQWLLRAEHVRCAGCGGLLQRELLLQRQHLHFALCRVGRLQRGHGRAVVVLL